MQYNSGGHALPSPGLVVSAPAPRPRAFRGEDARVFAGRALYYGDENAARLRAARRSYAKIRARYARGY